MCPGSCPSAQVRASVLAGALFALVASPQLFSLMQQLLGGLVRVASPSGAPTFAGLLLHSAVFGLLTYGLMCLAKQRRYQRRGGWMYRA